MGKYMPADERSCRKVRIVREKNEDKKGGKRSDDPDNNQKERRKVLKSQKNLKRSDRIFVRMK